MPKARKIRAGVARVNITPAVGVELVGFAGRGPSIGVGDELYATALVVDDGRETAAIFHLDLIGIDATWTQMAAELIGKRGRLPAENVVLCSTHTHYGPTVRAYDDDPNVSPEAAFMAELKFKLAGAVQEARSRMGPVVASVGRGTSDIGINRREMLDDGTVILGRNPQGTIDREVIVVRLNRPSGEPLACLLNFATHPVSQTGHGRLISADFPGYARETIEAVTGTTCMFIQGASGNINSDIMEHSLDTPKTLGKILGGAAISAYETAEPVALGPIGVACKEAKLPAKNYDTLEDAQSAVAEHQAACDEAVAGKGNKGRIWWAEHQLNKAKACLESFESGKPLPPVVAPIWGVVMGDVGLATGPGEIFCQIGMAVKDAGAVAHTMYASCTNGSIGYVPMPEAYPDGGYEVDRASRVGPGAATIVTDTAIAMLKRAKSRARRK